jgi:hypothetical protein
VFLLQLLRLLLVRLLDLLLSRFVRLLLRQPLVVLFLLLLEFLVVLFLLSVKLFLLLLIFLIQFRVSRVWRSGAWVRRKVLRMDWRGTVGGFASGRLFGCPVIGWFGRFSGGAVGDRLVSGRFFG